MLVKSLINGYDITEAERRSFRERADRCLRAYLIFIEELPEDHTLRLTMVLRRYLIQKCRPIVGQRLLQGFLPGGELRPILDELRITEGVRYKRPRLRSGKILDTLWYYPTQHLFNLN